MCLPIAVNFPDKVLAKGEHLGYEWTITNNGYGIRCGYIKLPRGHPWWGKGYDEIPADVHGGITFAEHDKPCGQGQPDDGFWIGFDCLHFNDAPDPSLKSWEPRVTSIMSKQMRGGQVRTHLYVVKQLRNLCRQAKEASR